MSLDTEKPYVLRVAEMIYSKIVDIKNENSGITNIQAFEVFMTTKDFDLISSGEYHDRWFKILKKNNFIDEITKKKKLIMKQLNFWNYKKTLWLNF